MSGARPPEQTLTLKALLREAGALMWRAPHVWLGLLLSQVLAAAASAAVILAAWEASVEPLSVALLGAAVAGGLLTMVAFVPGLCTGWMGRLALERAGLTPPAPMRHGAVLWSSFVLGVAATVGFQLLIGPGMWVMAAMGQAPAMVACEGTPGIEALSRSRALSEPARGPLMWVQGAVLLASIPLTALAAWPIAWEIAQTGRVAPAWAAGLSVLWIGALNLTMLMQGAVSAAAYAALTAAARRGGDGADAQAG